MNWLESTKSSLELVGVNQIIGWSQPIQYIDYYIDYIYIDYMIQQHFYFRVRMVDARPDGMVAGERRSNEVVTWRGTL